jgi:hypothetical protein
MRTHQANFQAFAQEFIGEIGRIDPRILMATAKGQSADIRRERAAIIDR